jgi:hypothetical protein
MPRNQSAARTLDRTDIIGRSGFRGAYWWATTISATRPSGKREKLAAYRKPHKSGSQSDSNARDSAIAASLALQFGCPLETLRGAVLRDSTGRPSTPLGIAIDAITGQGDGK